jgi:phospholipase/carboxylesterase
MHKKTFVTSGKNLKDSGKVVIMLHGRGADAQDIIGLASHLEVKDYSIIAPQATNNTWYPYSFLAPVKQNEPWLTSALEMIKSIVDDLNKQGIPSDKIYFVGFSQGACLTLEFVARDARKWGGVAAFTVGLIGDTIKTENYEGDFEGTKIFIGTSNPDPHVPVERVQASTAILRKMNAVVTEKIYPGMGHTVSEDEIQQANNLIFSNV